ncbi:MAG: transglycosylase domain-containing protein [Burkholderiaceae bacterium]
MATRLAAVASLLGRGVLLVLVAVLALQLYFLLRVALMTVVNPESTTFQRSEIWRLLGQHDRVAWSRRWVDYAQIGAPLKRAVIAAEDAGYTEHHGVEWDAIERAWERNQQAQARTERATRRLEAQAARRGTSAASAPPAKLVGGSTITQQLAKNLFLGSERSLARKAQEIVIVWMLEGLLDKRRILEIYLNHVEWGEGVFGAEAAAQHYFRRSAATLTPQQAAQLAVMLPAPKRFEQRPGSAYVLGRAATILARMPAVALP